MKPKMTFAAKSLSSLFFSSVFDFFSFSGGEHVILDVDQAKAAMTIKITSITELGASFDPAQSLSPVRTTQPGDGIN